MMLIEYVRLHIEMDSVGIQFVLSVIRTSCAQCIAPWMVSHMLFTMQDATKCEGWCMVFGPVALVFALFAVGQSLVVIEVGMEAPHCKSIIGSHARPSFMSAWTGFIPPRKSDQLWLWIDQYWLFVLDRINL